MYPKNEWLLFSIRRQVRILYVLNIEKLISFDSLDMEGKKRWYSNFSLYWYRINREGVTRGEGSAMKLIKYHLSASPCSPCIIFFSQQDPPSDLFTIYPLPIYLEFSMLINFYSDVEDFPCYRIQIFRLNFFHVYYGLKLRKLGVLIIVMVFYLRHVNYTKHMCTIKSLR